MLCQLGRLQDRGQEAQQPCCQHFGAVSLGDPPKERWLRSPQTPYDGCSHAAMKAMTVPTPKYRCPSSPQGAGTGMARVGHRSLQENRSQAHRTEKAANTTRETAVLAHLRCASLTEATAAGTVVSLNSAQSYPPPVTHGAMLCSAQPAAPTPPLPPPAPSTSLNNASSVLLQPSASPLVLPWEICKCCCISGCCP